MLKNMAYLRQTILLLICAQCVRSTRIGGIFSTYENTSSVLYSGYDGDQLSSFDEPQCKKSENEIHLKLSNVGLKRIPEHFVDSQFVTCLSLDDNNIEDISTAAFERLPNLQFLNLSGNTVSQEKIFTFSRNENLKTLVLDNVSHPAMDHSFIPFEGESSFPSRYQQERAFPFPNLKSLSLRRNNINNVDLKTLLFKLTHLRLSQNRLATNINYVLKQLPPSVTHLSLDRNSIRTLELDYDVPQNLVFLNLNNNRFTGVCSYFYDQGSLFISSSPKLQYLLLSGNQIKNVEEAAFRGIPQLLHLDLSHNQIESFDEDIFGQLVDLRNFIGNDNQIKTIPTFSRNPNIKKINLRNNQIQTIENDVFSNLPSLEYLDLSGNGMSYLPANWKLLRMNLRVLLLKDNLFTDLQSFHLSQAVRLTDLHIEGNPITSLNRAKFIDIPTNLSVHIQNQDC